MSTSTCGHFESRRSHTRAMDHAVGDAQIEPGPSCCAGSGTMSVAALDSVWKRSECSPGRARGTGTSWRNNGSTSAIADGMSTVRGDGPCRRSKMNGREDSKRRRGTKPRVHARVCTAPYCYTEAQNHVGRRSSRSYFWRLSGHADRERRELNRI